MKIVYDMANGTIQSDEARHTRGDDGRFDGHEAQLHLELQEFSRTPATGPARAARIHLLRALRKTD